MILQVNKLHYNYTRYLTKERWISIWHQIDEVLTLNPTKVLEVGPGPGVFKYTLLNNGILVETVDIDPELNPDYIASVTQLPFVDESYDCVCAFQVLEHLKYEESLRALNEMIRVSSRYVIISLPDSKILWRYSFYFPKIGQKTFQIPRLYFKKTKHVFDGEHYWEINKKGYSFKKLISDFNSLNVEIRKSYRVNEYTYHHFIVFEKKQ